MAALACLLTEQSQGREEPVVITVPVSLTQASLGQPFGGASKPNKHHGIESDERVGTWGGLGLAGGKLGGEMFWFLLASGS